MKKRFFLLVMCIALVGLCACNKEDANEKKAQADSADQNKIEQEEKKEEEKAKEEKEEKKNDTNEEKSKVENNDPTKSDVTNAPTKKGAKPVYLTFDDGPSDNTVKILDALDKYNAKATFFVIYNSKYDNLYKEIVNKGHALALHSYSHKYEVIYTSEEAYFNDLNKLASHIKEVTGQEPKLIRFPGGSSNTVSRNYSRGIMSRLTKSVTAKGYSYFDWNVSSGDASSKALTPQQIVSNVVGGCDNVSKNPVVLMHDAAAKYSTAEAVPTILEQLKNKGYSFETLDPSVVVHHGVNN